MRDAQDNGMVAFINGLEDKTMLWLGLFFFLLVEALFAGFNSSSNYALGVGVFALSLVWVMFFIIKGRVVGQMFNVLFMWFVYLLLMVAILFAVGIPFPKLGSLQLTQFIVLIRTIAIVIVSPNRKTGDEALWNSFVDGAVLVFLAVLLTR